MKKNIFITLFMLFIMNIFAQEPHICGVNGDAFYNSFILNHPEVFRKNLNATIVPTPNEPLVFNIRFNVFNNNQETNYCSRNGIPLGLEEFLEYTKILNLNFKQFNIYFKFRGYRFFGGSDGKGYLTNSQTYSGPPSLGTPSLDNHMNEMADLTNKDEININFVNRLGSPIGSIPTEGPGGTETLFTHSAFFGKGPFGSNTLVLSLPGFMGVPDTDVVSYTQISVEKNYLLCHEMSHLLGLNHVFNYSNGLEHATRSGVNYNALVAGDFIDDTPAQNQFREYLFNDSCFKIYDYVNPANNKDSIGEEWDFLNLKYGNFQQYCQKDIPVPTITQHNACVGLNNFDGSVTYKFTAGQGAFMRNFIENGGLPPSYPTGINSTSIIDATTEVSELYQPFYVGAGTGYSNGNTTQTYSKTITPNLNNTGINIWNCGPFKMRFQGGFDQEFSNLLGGTVSQT